MTIEWSLTSKMIAGGGLCVGDGYWSLAVGGVVIKACLRIWLLLLVAMDDSLECIEEKEGKMKQFLNKCTNLNSEQYLSW